MGMKHLWDYTDNYETAKRMYQRYKGNYPVQTFMDRRYNLDMTAKMDLFYAPADYQMWFVCPRDEGLVTPLSYPICYLVAEDDVIPIRIEQDAVVQLTNPLEIETVWHNHGDVLSAVLKMVSDYHRIIYDRWQDQVDEYTLTETLNIATESGWRYYPDFLECHSIPVDCKIIRGGYLL